MSEIKSLPISAPSPSSTPLPDPAPRVEVAGQWLLMWWKFRKHKLALASGIITLFFYGVALLVEFIAPYSPEAYDARYTYAPPQGIHFFQNTPEGFRIQIFTYGLKSKVDPVAFRRVYEVDPNVVIPLGLFIQGEPYKLWGLIPLNVHLIGPLQTDMTVHFLGADRLGRDLFSRMVYGTRISMSIGLVGVIVSLVLGILLGGISGYFGGTLDDLIQRAIELLRSIPQIPLWMGLAAAIPPATPPLDMYFMITIILSFIGWTGMARVVRGKFLSLKTEDFVTAAKLDGLSELRIITRHMIPSFMSHIIASVTLAIPGMILSETSLSFLGIGLRSPVVSWGVLLKEAQNIRTIATAPWLLWPGVAVIVAVLALNFLGDGLRDAADPYES